MTRSKKVNFGSVKRQLHGDVLLLPNVFPFSVSYESLYFVNMYVEETFFLFRNKYHSCTFRVDNFDAGIWGKLESNDDLFLQGQVNYHLQTDLVAVAVAS